MGWKKLLSTLCVVSLLSLASSYAQEDPQIDLTPPTLGDFDPASLEGIVVEDAAIIPELTDHARQIYEKGQAAGRHAAVFSKVGDCMTAATYFFAPFGGDDYDLGIYGDLDNVINAFKVTPIQEQYNSFSNPGLATESGFNAASVLDSIWADPEVCSPDESPLTCEYRVSNPSFSLIMFGTNDVYFLDEATFDYYLRTIVLQTINANIVPVLSTFPTRPEFPEKTVLYNRLIIKIAQDYDLPLVNLWLAIQELPNEGVDPVEPIHLSIPPDEKTGDFVNNMDYGYTVRNMIMLQTLDKLWVALQG